MGQKVKKYIKVGKIILPYILQEMLRLSQTELIKLQALWVEGGRRDRKKHYFFTLGITEPGALR